jgi:hypothetical protein
VFALNRSLFKRGVNSDECSKGLGGCRMYFPRNSSVKSYTEIFYILKIKRVFRLFNGR